MTVHDLAKEWLRYATLCALAPLCLSVKSYRLSPSNFRFKIFNLLVSLNEFVIYHIVQMNY